MSRLLKEIAPHNAPGPRAITITPCLVCGDAGEGMDCCPAALCTPCLSRAAKAQGSLFRCPLCRDDGAFVIAAKRRGVVANTKTTPKYASGDDLTIRRRCNAPRCKAPGGRFVDARPSRLEGEKWALATCGHCGQTSRHRGCVKRFEGFRCDDCDVQVLERTADDFRRGDRVEARFSGGPRWYGAEVVAVVEDGCRVKYDDDGSLETIRVAARIRHRATEEDRSPPRSSSDEDEDEDDDDAALRLLRERVRAGRDEMTAARLDALLVGWTGSRQRRRRTGYTYSFVSPSGETFGSISRAAAAICGTAAPFDSSGVPTRCEVRRVGDTRWHRFESFAAAGRRLNVNPGYLSEIANDSFRNCPALVREKFEVRRLADDDDDDAPAADEPPPVDDDGAALRALRERVRILPAARGMTAARLDALLAGWTGSRRPNPIGRNGWHSNGYSYSFLAPGGAKFPTIAAAAAAVREAAGEAAARPAPAPAPASRPSRSHRTRGAAAEAPAPAVAPPLRVSLVSEAAAREDLREHLRGLPGVEASQLDALLAGWQATRRRREDGATYSFISPGGEQFTSLSRAAWAARRLAPAERQLRAEAERLRSENDALRNERLARAARPQQGPVVVNHGRRDAGLGAWMAETQLDAAVGTDPVVVNQSRPVAARRVTAGAPVVPPAPAVPAWPAPTEHPAATVEPAPTEQPPWAPPPPLGHAAAILAADTAFCAASAAALLNLREALSAVEALATSDFQGPMKQPVARLSIITRQLATHVAASEAQLPVRMAEAVAAAAPWTPHEDARLRTMGGNLGARSDWRAIAAWLGNSRTAGGVEARWRELTSGDGTHRTADEDWHAHTVERTHWKPEEDQRLLQLVRKAVKRDGSGGTWAHVAASFPDCTAADAEARWRTLAARDPDRKRPREGHRSGWSLDEETRLREVVEAERKAIAGGAPKAGVWDRVAVALGTNRTGSAVSAHWQLMHRDGTRTAAARWTPDEEQKLRRLIEAERAANRGNCRGSFWAGAAEALATKRTGTAVKQHWQVMNGQRPSKKARTDEPPPTMNGAPRPSKKARTDEPPPPEEEADDPLLDPFGLRAGLAALFSPWGWGS